ncbi:acid phosphatase [Aureobasidium pullulans]|nr:acid phosphatase [Aureobasidium pullulans]
MYLTLGLIIFPLAVNAVNIVLSNDDGWADSNIRVLYRTLKASGHGILLSAPSIDQSGTGSSMSPPAPLDYQCQYHTCPFGSPATGMWQTEPNITYVNSFPASAMDYGINISGPKRFGGRRPDLAISGINNGNVDNSGIAVPFSGTFGAATHASILGIPSIVFSGQTNHRHAWKAIPPLHSRLYSALATNLTNTLLASGPPYLPPLTFLNVNFAAADPGLCDQESNFRFVMTRLYPAFPGLSGKDISVCGGDQRLVTEEKVLKTQGCWISVSLGRAITKRDAPMEEQKVVYEKLKSLFVCLPDGI